MNPSFKSIKMLLTLFLSLITVIHTSFQKFNYERSDQIAEKVYLHIDRRMYSSSDEIWFKAYVIDPSTNKLSTNTNNLHIELISPASKIIQERIIRILNGIGKGDFSLNDSIPSGEYKIRAYTNHMRNYGDDLFFTKSIIIVNPYDSLKNYNPPTQKINNDIDIKFFPEGGSLVDNVTSRIGFKAINALGKGCDVTINLKSESGEIIAAFNSSHLGMGYFNLKPIPGFKYKVGIKSKDGIEKEVSLPQSFSRGVVMRTEITPDKKLLLTITTNEETLPLLSDYDLSVNLSLRNLVNRTMKIRINSLVNIYSLPLDEIPDGILRVTLSVPDGLPLCERLVFLQKNDKVRLNVSVEKERFKPREKVNTEISLSGDSTFTGTGFFSLSAAEESYTDNRSYPTSIASWFLLESDVRGFVEEPSYYFDPENKNRIKDLDLLLMTQGWRDFNWKYDTLNSFNNEIGFTYSGSLNRLLTNSPLDNVNISLGLFTDRSSTFFNTVTDRNGAFKFENLDIDGNVTAITSSTVQGRLFINLLRNKPPDISLFQRDTILILTGTKDLSAIQNEVSIKLNDLKKYKLNDTITLGEVSITAKRKETPQEVRVKESRRIYNQPDKELIITAASENYTGDIFSFISGRVGAVRVVRGVDPCSIYYPDDAEVYIREQFIIEEKLCNKLKIKIRRGAIFLLDGREVTPENLVTLLTMPMKMVDRIDVLNASPLYGMRGANGVINVITKTGTKRISDQKSTNSVTSIIKGFDVPKVFYTPKYDNKTPQTYTPDYRTTIFWEPDIVVLRNQSVNFEYYNADTPGDIKIVVEGITEEGIPLTATTLYNIK